MSTVADELNAAAAATAATTAAATAATTAAAGRIDAVEQGEIQMTAQLTGIAQQLQALPGGGAGGGLGAGGGGATQRRRIDPSGLEKLHADISLPQLRTWRNRWGDFCQLNQLATYPVAEQMAAFRMVLDPAMQQIVEVALGILPTSALSPTDVLDRISTYIRSKRNIALDRVAFEECEQSAAETFDDFYIRLRNLAEAADLCGTCLDTRMTTRVMAGIRDARREKKIVGPESVSNSPTGHQHLSQRRVSKSEREILK